MADERFNFTDLLIKFMTVRPTCKSKLDLQRCSAVEIRRISTAEQETN
jgi:hypothetical protein